MSTIPDHEAVVYVDPSVCPYCKALRQYIPVGQYSECFDSDDDGEEFPVTKTCALQDAFAWFLCTDGCVNELNLAEADRKHSIWLASKSIAKLQVARGRKSEVACA